MANEIHTLKLPVYVDLGRRVRAFLHMVEKPVATGSLMGEFCKSNGLVTLYYREGENKHHAVFTPVKEDTKLSDATRKKLSKDTSIFMSKLNSSMSLLGKGGCEICINLVEDLEKDAKKIYGIDIKSLIVVTITVKEGSAAQLAINSFFTVIENSSLNFE